VVGNRRRRHKDALILADGIAFQQVQGERRRCPPGAQELNSQQPPGFPKGIRRFPGFAHAHRAQDLLLNQQAKMLAAGCKGQVAHAGGHLQEGGQQPADVCRSERLVKRRGELRDGQVGCLQGDMLQHGLICHPAEAVDGVKSIDGRFQRHDGGQQQGRLPGDIRTKHIRPPGCTHRHGGKIIDQQGALVGRGKNRHPVGVHSTAAAEHGITEGGGCPAHPAVQAQVRLGKHGGSLDSLRLGGNLLQFGRHLPAARRIFLEVGTDWRERVGCQPQQVRPQDANIIRGNLEDMQFIGWCVHFLFSPFLICHTAF